MSTVNTKATQSVTISNARGLMVTYETSTETNVTDFDGDVTGGTNNFDGSLIAELAEAFSVIAESQAGSDGRSHEEVA